MKLGLRSKLLFISLALIAVSVLVGYNYVRGELESEQLVQAQKIALVRSGLVADIARRRILELSDRSAKDALARELAAAAKGRVIVLDRNGAVTGDSAPANDPFALGRSVEVKRLLTGERREPVVELGTSAIAVTVPLLSAEDSSRAMRVSLPVSELVPGSRALERSLAVLIVLAVAIAVIMASIASELAARVTRPFTGIARRLAAGDLAARSRVSAADDYGDLGRALNKVARNVSRSLGELREERDRLNDLLSGMQEGMLLLDGSGRVVLVNPALREMLLLGPDAVGKTLLEVIRHAELKQLLDQARLSSEPIGREIEIGSIKPRRLLVRVSQLAGQRDQSFAVFVDVTEMRRLESMRRDFVANVSHELRTPVTAIRSAAETLLSGLPRDPQVLGQFIGIIERNAARLQDLVEDVLDLSRIESRELKLHPEPLDLRVVYGQVLTLFRERADRKGIQLLNEATGELPRVIADRRALEHVLTNLVDNAVKYCGSGSRVRASGMDLGDSVRLLVSDDGPGIEQRHLPRIFERFYRVDAGRSRDLGGTGLGLSIVKHLVEAMGGSVQVESTPGAGTTFSFTLKKARPESAKAVA